MNILYIGSSGALSLVPFKKLLSSTHTVSAVGVVNPVTFDNKIIALENESLALAANVSTVPIIDMAQPVQDIVAQCEIYSIDTILMSCYSKRLPEEITRLAAYGCFNMHPSLLPHFRGPEPIFWQMKAAAAIGVSWHQVVVDFDAGDIVAQQKVRLDDGVKYSAISLQLAETGAELMLKLLSELTEDDITSSPQDSTNASYYGYPEPDDFILELNCSAQQIYNFICATQMFKNRYQCQINNYLFYIDEALDYDNNRTLDTAEVQGNSLYIPCNQGVLTASYTDKIPL